MLKALLDGYTALIQQRDDAESALNQARGALRKLDCQTDRLSKDWYQIVKNTYDLGTPAYDALAQIPTEGGTPASDVIDIDELVQGGEQGLQVLVSYLASSSASSSSVNGSPASIHGPPSS